ncbi:unnamed protein product, partial [Ranitomeya imitator]
MPIKSTKHSVTYIFLLYYIFTIFISGVLTGNCTPINNEIKSCEVYAWCPVENDYVVPNPPLLLQAENFTLFIKNSISFPKHKVNRQNLVESVTSSYLKTCTYHKDTDPLCPVFRLGYIVEQTGQKFSDIARKGGTIGIIIDWHCDLDWPLKYCKPTYFFHALHDENSVSQGFNFRHARYYKEEGIQKRTLFKVFGIRFDILVNGEIGPFTPCINHVPIPENDPDKYVGQQEYKSCSNMKTQRKTDKDRRNSNNSTRSRTIEMGRKSNAMVKERQFHVEQAGNGVTEPPGTQYALHTRKPAALIHKPEMVSQSHLERNMRS